MFQRGGVGEVSEREGGEADGLMSLSVTSSVDTRCNPTLPLPRRVSGKVLWVWGFSCVCVRACVGVRGRACAIVCFLLLLLLPPQIVLFTYSLIHSGLSPRKFIFML